MGFVWPCGQVVLITTRQIRTLSERALFGCSILDCMSDVKHIHIQDLHENVRYFWHSRQQLALAEIAGPGISGHSGNYHAENARGVEIRQFL